MYRTANCDKYHLAAVIIYKLNRSIFSVLNTFTISHDKLPKPVVRDPQSYVAVLISHSRSRIYQLQYRIHSFLSTLLFVSHSTVSGAIEKWNNLQELRKQGK